MLAGKTAWRALSTASRSRSVAKIWSECSRPACEFQRLSEDDGQGISLLPGRAAGHPGPQRLTGRAPGQQRRDGLVFQVFPRLRVAEEARHADQELLEQQFQLLGILLQEPDIAGNPVDLVDAHAPLDPAVDGGLLVQGKVVARLRPQQDDDLFQGALGFVFQGKSGPGDEGHVVEKGDDLAGKLLHRGDDVGQPGVDGASGHAVEFGRRRLLHKDHPGFFLDGPEAQRAVGAHAREDHADALVLPVIGQGAEEEIDGQAQAPGRHRREQVQHTVQDGHVPVRRDHIDAVRLDVGAILDLDDLHGGAALQQFHHDALVRRVQVLDDDKGHAAGFRHFPQELFQRLQPPGRSADADDREGSPQTARAALFGRPALRSRTGGFLLFRGGLFPFGFGSLFHGSSPCSRPTPCGRTCARAAPTPQ